MSGGFQGHRSPLLLSRALKVNVGESIQMRRSLIHFFGEGGAAAGDLNIGHVMRLHCCHHPPKADNDTPFIVMIQMRMESWNPGIRPSCLKDSWRILGGFLKDLAGIVCGCGVRTFE